MDRYTIKSLIGEGSFGRVYKALRNDDTQVVAIKVISKRGRSSRELKNLRRECDIQATLKHPNVIEMLESFETKHNLVVVTEFSLIDLHRYLSRNGTFTEDVAQRLICNLVSALYYLHSNRILHRDLKPQNVLLNEDLHAKLCDFGLARNMTHGTHVLTSIKGTPLYMAPELLAEKPYDHLADFWSLGCIAYETMSGQPPFCTTSILHLIKLIKHEEVKWPSYMSRECCSFLQGLLEKDPSMRITWAQILCHPFVEGKLFISGIKSDNSPFINPQQRKPAKKDEKKKNAEKLEESSVDKISDNLAELQLANTSKSLLSNNMTTSSDSINAIAPSDIENIETDLEDDKVTVPFAETSYKGENLLKDVIGPKLAAMTAAGHAVPVVTSMSCFVGGNNNMILNHLNDNFLQVSTDNSVTKETTEETPSKDTNHETTQISIKTSRNKDLEKRKLSQNLDNFSLRLGHSVDAETQRKTADKLAQKKEKEKTKEVQKSRDKTHQKVNISLKNSTQSVDEKHNSDNSPPCLLPGWDSCDDSQSPPIENDEWLAFLHRTMQEVLDGELDSLKQHNLVSIIVAPLRNSKAIPKVLECVAQLLSLPFVLGGPNSVIELVQNVYIDVKLVPNLMYASKLLIYKKIETNESNGSFHQTTSSLSRHLRSLKELSVEETRTASRLYELVCHLVHLKQQFLVQFCDAIIILGADELLINLMQHDFKNTHATRISNCILGLLCCVLRELPENAELVENIVFSSKLNLHILLTTNCNLTRQRMCMLIRLLARFSLRRLQVVWNREMKQAIESLAEDTNSIDVKEIAEGTLAELSQFSFYE